MIDYESLTPSHEGSIVWPVYYGGPMDGQADRAVSPPNIKGKLKFSRGYYSLQGFRRSPAPQGLEQFAMEFAVYQWVYEK